MPIGRPLEKALAAARQHLEASVDVGFADLPRIEGATADCFLQQMVAVAELEAGMISARTMAAPAAARKRGTKLGGQRGRGPTLPQSASGARQGPNRCSPCTSLI